ncbi:spermidine/putrescine-binding periplasmic protein [Desulfitobacterium dehalogenans ATCC 51507]|uniref:Spermidine/putrescine-binding periplasmic protein n=1 Tax=Desulfitobacterium dehalogenans (strain ATCC 51507 / DSM 9161 / JW/IU-DC1) TaxID=756499 RepID=I4A911_DESDJ|nr:ABC transporter substrate-binding protein [Desulfitobacterium dehalogenans]AFM00446.1 spermidine/putrescine-binding periplasmic protein [Desulfitobacterium dehalogenans ATCC 51507]
MKKSVLKKAGVVVLLVAMLLGLAGCGGSDQAKLYVYNWGDYIDESVLAEFEKANNVDVIYEQFATNEEMYVKIKAGTAKYDVAIPSDYMITKMIHEGLLHTIDMNTIPNYAKIDDRFKNLAFDTKNEYSVPYMWGTVGIIYNKTMVDGVVDSWDILWDKKYAKQILMLDSQRDSIAVALKKLGYSLNSREEKELDEAKKLLIQQKPLLMAYVGDEVKDKMIGNEAAMAVVWSGDAVFMKGENPNLEYVIPKEGSNIWYDSMVIPKTSQNKEMAEKFIDFMCSTDVAYKNADYIGYSTPQKEVRGMLPEDLTSDPAYYPAEGALKGSEVFEDLSDVLPIYDRIWTEVKSQ